MSSRSMKREFSSVYQMITLAALGASMSIPSILFADQPAPEPNKLTAQETTDAVEPAVREEQVPVVKAEDVEQISQDSAGLSNKALIGIGGAAVLLGVVAASNSGSSSDNGSSASSGSGAGSSGSTASPAQAAPPKASQMVGVWYANARSVEHKHYVGTYTLYSNGRHQYNIVVETGKRKTGNGRWDLRGYRLSLHNDSGTTYSGSFKNGKYSSLTLGTSVGWTLSLHR